MQCSLRVDDIKKNPLPLLHGFHASDADSNHVSLCMAIKPAVMATDFNFSFELNGPPPPRQGAGRARTPKEVKQKISIYYT